MLKHIKLSDYHGLAEFETIFSHVLCSEHKKDLCTIGKYTYSSCPGAGVEYYLVWNRARCTQVEKLLKKAELKKILKVISTSKMDSTLQHKCTRVLERISSLHNAGHKHSREDAKLIALMSMIGYIELEPVERGWKAKHVQFAFISREARGKGIAKKLYEIACHQGREILAAGEQQTKAARRLWISIIKSSKFTVWVETEDDKRFVITHKPEAELCDGDHKDENNLVETPMPIWVSDTAKNNPGSIRMYAIAS